MSTRTALKGRIGAIVSSVALVAVVGGGVGAYALAPKDEAPAAVVVETVEPVDLMQIPLTNGLAAEQEADGAAVEAARIEAERVEAERVAAEAAAAAAAAEAARVEAERVAAEQAAQEEADRAARQQSRQQSNNNTGGGDTGGGESGGSFGNGTRAPWVDLGNGTGMWDFSNCPTQSGTTGSDGNVYCE